MIVDLSAVPATVREAGDLKGLHVVAPKALDVDRALRAAGLGSGGSDDRVLLGVEALRSAAEAVGARPGWAAEWDAMVAYAATKGWVTEDGSSLVAHVERTP